MSQLTTLTKRLTQNTPPETQPQILLNIFDPIPNAIVHAQPRVRWRSLTNLAPEMRIQAVVQRGSDAELVGRFDVREKDFYIPLPLDKGDYRIRLVATAPDVPKIISYAVPFRVDWHKANEHRIDCVSPWRHLFALGRDRVRPCCMLKEGVIFPTDPNDTEADLWNNPGMLELRDALRKGDTRYCHPHCGSLVPWGQHDGVQPADRTSYDRGEVIQEVPLSLKISLGSRCNHKCTFCKMGSSKYNHWEQQDYAFAYLIRNAEKLDQISLTGGEPLVHFKRHHRKLTEAFARAKRLNVRLQTNGALIHKYMDVLSAIPNLTLSVSMAGANRQDYLKLHRVDDFDRVCANLKAIRKARGDKPTAIEIKMVYTKRNYHGVPSFPGLAYEIGADQIYFHHLMVLAQTDIDPADEIKPDDLEHEELMSGLAQARSRADQYGLQMRVTDRDHKKVRIFNTKDTIETDDDDDV